MSSSNSSVIQYLRQYEMFSNSLKLVKKVDEKEMIIKQLTKLEYKILDATNEGYEEEYYALANKECGLLEEEKKRISMLIDLINQRLSYVEKRCNDHYQLTGETLDVNDVLGANTLDTLENRLSIIEKYMKNIKLEKELNEEIQGLSNKISLASEKIAINDSLNKELESKFKSTIHAAFEENNLYSLLDVKDDIEYAYFETEKSLTLAELNMESAKSSPLNVFSDCQKALDEVKKDYEKYKDKLSLLRLMEIFNRDVSNYEELLNKRKEINDLFKYIKNDEFVNAVIDMVSEQYNTILMEQQDINTFDDLTSEKERKMEALVEIENENNSDEFQAVLKVLIENERKKEEKIEEEKRRLEEEERKKKLELEKKRQEEILKRQKIIEEARKKEIEKRTKQLLEQQQNSVLQNKHKEKAYSFETMKDNIAKRIEDNSDLVASEKSESKDRSNIEKELFDEFANDNKQRKHRDIDELLNNLVLDDEDNEKKSNQLPDVSLDEYMKNFDEKAIDNDNSFFSNNDVFPNIPV